MKIRKIRVQSTAWLQFATKELPTIPATIVTVFLQDKRWKINTSCSTFKPYFRFAYNIFILAVFATIKSILAGLTFCVAGKLHDCSYYCLHGSLKNVLFCSKSPYNHFNILLTYSYIKGFFRWKALPWCYVSKDVDCMFFLVFSIKKTIWVHYAVRISTVFFGKSTNHDLLKLFALTLTWKWMVETCSPFWNYITWF